MEYKIVNSINLHTLEAKVNGHLRDGWTLQGGVGISDSKDVSLFCQAMVRKDTEAKVINMYDKLSIKGNTESLRPLNHSLHSMN